MNRKRVMGFASDICLPQRGPGGGTRGLRVSEAICQEGAGDGGDWGRAPGVDPALQACIPTSLPLETREGIFLAFPQRNGCMLTNV